MKSSHRQLMNMVLTASLVLGLRGAVIGQPAPGAAVPAAPGTATTAPAAVPGATPAAVPAPAASTPTAAPSASPALAPEPSAPEAVNFHDLASQVATLTVPVIWQRLPRFGLALFARAGQTEGQPAQGVATPPTYALGPGDQVSVRCFGEAIEHLNTTVMVSPEGNIYIPLLGEVPVSGNTLGVATAKIAELLRQFYPKSQVAVDISQPRMVDIYVLGDVLRPGKYSLPGTGTLFTALYAAGGPSDIGSLRHVKLVPLRDAPVSYDLYSYLLEGNRVAQQVLNPGDTIFVGTQEAEVGIVGEVRRSARYEVTPGASCGDLITMAGGIAPMAYTPDIQIWRVKEGEYRTLTGLTLKQANDFKLQDGDLIVIRPILEQFVEISGAVLRPGGYQWGQGMKISDLVTLAGGLVPESYGTQATLVRLRDADAEREVIQVHLAEALQHDKTADVALLRGDTVHVFTKDEQRPRSEVWVDGSVQRRGNYPRYEHMRISDLIFAAGGLTPDASDKGVHSLARQVGSTVITELNIKQENGKITVDPDLVLSDDDYVAINGRGGFVARPPHVRITGRVLTPGSYGLSTSAKQTTTVYDVLQQAGGLLPDGNARGILLFRPKSELWLNREALLQNALVGLNRTQGTIQGAPTSGAATSGAATSGAATSGAATSGAANSGAAATAPSGAPATTPANAEQTTLSGQVASVFTQGTGDNQVVGLLIPPRSLNLSGLVQIVPIDGEKLLATKGKEGDAVLADEDYIVVQRTLDTVAIFGAVAQSGEIPFKPHERVREAVVRTGGLAEDADPQYITVLRANGKVLPEARVRELEQGDIVIVPSKYLMKIEAGGRTFFDRLWTGLMQAFALNKILH